MSSEMRECPFCGSQPRSGWCGTGVPGMDDCGYWGIDCCNAFAHADTEAEALAQWNRRALLARTEARADGAVAWRVEWDEDNDGDAFYVTLDTERGAMGRANEAIAEGFKGVRIRRLVYGDTHPQDASGDADAAYAILDRLTTTREGCLQLAKVIYRELDRVEKLLDEAVEKCAAMQAKEAK